MFDYYSKDKINIKRLSLKTAFPIKNSPHCTTLELFAQELYEKIVDINDYKTFSLIENFKSDSRKGGI